MDKQLLMDLCALDGVAGREGKVRDFILQKLNDMPTPKEVLVDAMGNILVHLQGKSPATKKVLFDAHMDEVGFFVTHIFDDGTLSFVNVGGIDKNVLFGQRVRIGNVYGVIGGKAVHQCSEEEKKRVPNIEDMVIDIGAATREEAQKLVKIGQEGTFACDLQEWQEGTLVGKALDDRVGCAILLSLAAKQPQRDIWLSFSVQEEVGLRGADVVTAEVCPDIAIAIDATTAADVAGSTDKTCVCRVDHGPVVSFVDGGTLYDQELYQQIRSLSADNGIKSQTKNRIAGRNNAASLQRSFKAVRVAAVSLPCRYIHSSTCFGRWSDIEAMEQLMHLLAERLPL